MRRAPSAGAFATQTYSRAIASSSPNRRVLRHRPVESSAEVVSLGQARGQVEGRVIVLAEARSLGEVEHALGVTTTNGVAVS